MILWNGNAVRPRRSLDSWTNKNNGRWVHEAAIFNVHDAIRYAGRSQKESTEVLHRNEIKAPVKSCLHALKINMKEFLEKCTLHGLRYVGDGRLSLGERIFWFVAFSCAFAFATYFITTLYKKWYASPVIISFNPMDATLDTIPFPAITICNMNQAVRKEAEDILTNGLNSERHLLEDYCNLNNTFSSEASSTDWDIVLRFILKVGQPCTAMLKACRWGQTTVDCTKIFKAQLTDEGLCCSFNMVAPELIFRDVLNIDLLNNSFPRYKHDWSPEKGYTSSVPRDALPLRPLGAGAHLGLGVVLDAQVKDYYCSSTNSAGFKVLLSNPIETPKMADFSFFVSTGVESRIIIIPEISEATHSLRSIAFNKRKCFFNDERPLQYYRTYTERNCKLECQANHTQNKCGCVPYFLPKNANTTICGRREEDCSDKAKVEMEDIAQTGFSCNCLPGCFELSYGKWGSQSMLTTKAKINRIPANIPPDYFIENVAIMHFYFDKVNFKKTIKSELYGFSEFLSNTGGLLGLFLGFSFLSAIEIAYYLSLKLMCNLVRKRKLENNNTALIPFMK